MGCSFRWLPANLGDMRRHQDAKWKEPMTAIGKWLRTDETEVTRDMQVDGSLAELLATYFMVFMPYCIDN